MKMHAIVFTTTDDPTTPRLDDAWDDSMVQLNPDGIRQSFADAISSDVTSRATIVTIEVDDAQLLERLAAAAPPIPGVIID